MCSNTTSQGTRVATAGRMWLRQKFTTTEDTFAMTTLGGGIMIRDEWQNWFYMLLAVGVVLWVAALFGCASPDPPAPIQAYRAAYGFPP
jgi:hypothetical protein